MCGIFGIIDNNHEFKNLNNLVHHARQRGKDSSGMVCINSEQTQIFRGDFDILKLTKNKELKKAIKESNFLAGHSRLITNGLGDNQPVRYNDVIILHNGIIVNHEEEWKKISKPRKLEIDTEIIGALTELFIETNGLDKISVLGNFLFERLDGVISCAIILPKEGKLVLSSNNGSLYVKETKRSIEFSSEVYPLIENSEIKNSANTYQILNKTVVFDLDIATVINECNFNERSIDLIPKFSINQKSKSLLEYPDTSNLKRCTKCILPSTMPFIKFDAEGVCNYCKNYTTKNNPKPKSELLKLLEPYRRQGNERDCIVPFSGGRDSAMGLHLMVKELGLKPITYTYDWGMVTDLGRRNISRMCSKLGVENIIVAADITQKRRNIKMNIEAWLKNPHLGMVNLFMAGDKHFFRYVEQVKKQTNISLNVWSVNPLEVTHFKAGFLGVPPYFEEDKVYNNGWQKQLFYHSKRFKQMIANPSYFNSSVFDTLRGEYYRSFYQKEDYYHLFDYYRWDESEVNNTIINEYGWEKAIDTSTTWRIGDGTAAFYNYIYLKVAGFTEHDTFRSNQIREGDISREEALNLIHIENQPRYENIQWYLDAVGLDFESTIKTINDIKPLF